MGYLSKEEVIYINHATVQRFGGHFVSPNNLLHAQSLDYLVESVSSVVFGDSLYPALHDKAAVYMFSIISNHVFQDGNKRTG
ncbi:Fic family protein [Lewinella sp. IMCC34183]|uniref:type II toxin-antitoxin system death-on-curing family toxin n=1 Tax=Lewinella sp. IMCC34183 TaxID=2248762 RepID=UPI000E24217E